ncbi:MAG: hypothetical protein ACK50Y_00565 [Flavobacteriia bacterium]
MAKKQRVKKNKEEKKNELKINRERINTYSIPSEDKVGLIICKKCFHNGLFLEMQTILSELSDEDAFVNFYISKDENNLLEDLFLDFNIPTNLWLTLKLAWLNMVFSNLLALRKDTIGSTNKKAMSDLYKSYDFLQEIAKGAIKVESFSFKHSIPESLGASGEEKKTSQFKGFLSNELFLKIIKDFFESDKNRGLKMMYEQHRNADWTNLDKRGSKKNNKSHSISIYTEALKNFFASELFSCDLHPIDQIDDYSIFLKNQKKLWPDNTIDQFIGRLMILSGLDSEILNETNEVKNEIVSVRQKKR